MAPDTLYAKFIGYGVYIHPSGLNTRPLMHLDLNSKSMAIYADDAAAVVPNANLAAFVDALKRRQRELRDLARLADERSGPLTLGRLAVEISSRSLVLTDRITAGKIHFCSGRSLRDIITDLYDIYRKVKHYVEPCLQIARSLERLPYEEFRAAMECNGYSTIHVHGIARLSSGKVEFRPVCEIVRSYSTDDPAVVTIVEDDHGRQQHC